MTNAGVVTVNTFDSTATTPVLALRAFTVTVHC
jgi:hypothetical protein